ncbi:hypothetical protein ACEWY4_014968 [Coilia grayii]|uniref:Uncharacterized protein n=1 Tax=Coilia grayii TaxID=363190 RepID=A0ABD1JTR0_9TELE
MFNRKSLRLKVGYVKQANFDDMPYRRKLPVESLSDVENPWRGITLNRCIALAVIVVVVSSGVEQVQEALDALLAEEDGLTVADGTEQSGSSLWDTLAFWNWGTEEEMAKKRARRKHRKKSLSEGLLRDKYALGEEDGDD